MGLRNRRSVSMQTASGGFLDPHKPAITVAHGTFLVVNQQNLFTIRLSHYLRLIYRLAQCVGCRAKLRLVISVDARCNSGMGARKESLECGKEPGGVANASPRPWITSDCCAVLPSRQRTGSLVDTGKDRQPESLRYEIYFPAKSISMDEAVMNRECPRNASCYEGTGVIGF